MNSDAAIVGLQAMHMLRGEWSPLLYGSAYQTSTDAVAAALVLAVAGATPLALVLSALLGHVALTWIVYALLARHVGRVPATLLATALVLTAPWIRRVPAPIARLAVFAVSTTAVTLVAFVVSRCAVDVYSYRYLVAPSLVVPLLLAPAAYVVRRRAWAGLLAAPIVISCGLAGWGALRNAVASQAPSVAQSEVPLERALAERGVTRAVASYWIAYRLTFLYGERLVVVPREAAFDRYRPYRDRVLGGDQIAYIVERWVPRDAAALRDERVRDIGVPYERFDAGRYTVLLVSRRNAREIAGVGFARTPP